LQNLKHSNPIELAEYGAAQGLLKEPSFCWWAQHVLKKKRRVISKVKTGYWQRTHKFGVRLPKSVAEALQFDKEDGNTLWYDAIQKELKNVKSAFHFLPDEETPPVGYKKIPCHIVFDVKMDFTRKACFVARGHKTNPPSTLTYSSVVSRESVKIAFLIAALNDLELLVADIGNAYINANAREKVYFIAGDEFGLTHKGKTVVIVKALYGLKSSGAAWRAHLSEVLHELGYTSSLTDPDVWFCAQAKEDGFEYYAYVLVYVDDILVVSNNVSGRFSTPMTNGYCPELDYSPFLADSAINYYMELIAILRWIVELRRIDIMVNVSMLSSYSMQPRQGHLDQVFYIFGYLKHNKHATLVFDESTVEWNEASFEKHDWTDFYQGVIENKPTNAPIPRGNPVQINCFVDSNHAGNKVTRRSQTGILIFLNRSPIIWYSKAQNTIESSTFGSEFTAMRIAVELLEALRYKLRMFGIPLDGPANTFCDNNSVVTNATQPPSTLKKKHNSIMYHKVPEADAANTIRVAWVNSQKNLADLLTKPLNGPALHNLCEKILYLYKDSSKDMSQ